ncbi:MAG: hypothetical protein ACI8YQ_005338 [Polaribacter sp.]|jgi:hypothetical protein
MNILQIISLKITLSVALFTILFFLFYSNIGYDSTVNLEVTLPEL